MEKPTSKSSRKSCRLQAAELRALLVLRRSASSASAGVREFLIMCCSEVCIYLGVGALRWLEDLLPESFLNRRGHKALKGATKFQLTADSGKYSSSAKVKYDLSDEVRYDNIIVNPKFSDGTDGWVGLGCSLAEGSYRGSSYCIVHGRKERSHGLAQEIGKRLSADSEYWVEAWVGMRNGQANQALVRAIVKVEKPSGDTECIGISSAAVRRGEWSLLTGTLRVGQQPHNASLHVDGPDGGVDILVSSVAIVPVVKTELNAEIERKHNADLLSLASIKPVQDTANFGVNIVDNSNDMKYWYAMGNCDLAFMPQGGPRRLGATAQNSLVNTRSPTLSGNVIYTSNRSETWEGPAQDITDKVQLFQSYQVFAWVATTFPPETVVVPQKVNVSLDVDGEWVSGGEVMAGCEWTEVCGSFRLESDFKKVVVYLQGPAPGVDVMLSGLQIFAADRLARVPLLQQQTDQVRKRDVVLTPRDCNDRPLPPGTKVSIRQKQNSFPLGTSITHEGLNNEKYKKFFLVNFNWAVFEYELKWDQMEWDQGKIAYEPADDLVRFCNSNDISMRGHCIVWECEEQTPYWVKELEGEELVEVVQQRFRSLLTRYKGQFEHYDVDNEILHGSFYKEKLGPNFWSYIFRLAHECDPKADLFVNDYHIEDGYDCTSSPERYIDLIRFLQSQGAPVGGIGVQGHIRVPIGPIVSQALNKLSTLNLPIWFTEVDVVSRNEDVRADDLEVMLREAFAHPSVKGCVLWGFMDKIMYEENAQLVEADGTITAAGRRLIALKKEWTTNFDGVIDENGDLVFRGFCGNYTFSVEGENHAQSFEVIEGAGPAFTKLSLV